LGAQVRLLGTTASEYRVQRGEISEGSSHGEWPGLAEANLIDGHLNGLNDYRIVLAEILEKRCGTGSLGQIFPGIAADRPGVVHGR